MALALPLASQRSTPVVPEARDVVIELACGTGRVQRQFLTCFRCGGSHHYKSECGNFRTRICLAWQVGRCRELYCPFAHGASELRSPWLPVCIRVLRTADGKIRRYGCGRQGHTYRTCPFAGATECLPCAPTS